MPQEEKDIIFQKRETLLSKVKAFINENLNPRKCNLFDPDKDNYNPPSSITDILTGLDISESDYYEALAISSDDDFQVHLERPPNSCFINNYFEEGLSAWEANIDIQPVFNHYKAVTYMCAYFSKCEDEASVAMKQAAKEAITEKNHIASK